MKSKYRILLLLSILLCAVCLAVFMMVPRFVESEKLMTELNVFLHSRVPARVSIGSIRWSWLPLPHVLINDAKVRGHDFHLVVPKGDIYPDWLSLLAGEPRLDRLVMKAPIFELLNYEPVHESLLDLSRLPGSIKVHGGTVRVAPGISMPGLLFGNRVTVFSHIDGELRMNRHDNSGRLTCSCVPSYSDYLHLEATMGNNLEPYSAWVRLDNLNLNKLFEFYTNDRSDIPVAHDINLFMSVSGERPGYVSGTLKADVPCITLADRNKDIDISCGVLSTDISMSPTGFKARIRQFDLEYPHLNMTGSVAMNKPPDDSGDANWSIDLKGLDVDLAGVRKVALNLFGSSSEARDVCDIVRGGRAPELTYGFKGKTSDFEFIDHMVLTAMVDHAPIYIPDPDLFLQEASGPIRIEGGILYGKNLTGRLGKAYAENGTLTLGLSEDLFNFNLDLDIKADLAELQPVLERLINDRDVVREIKKFHNTRGTAWGNLKIGNDLRDFDVWVHLNRVEGEAFYGRLGWPLTITDAKADISPHSVKWRDVSGTAGASSIRRFCGMVDWQGETELDISGMQADVNAGQVLNHLNAYPAISDDISKVVSGLGGTLSVNHVALHGPAFMPEKWHYSLDAAPLSLKIDSPLLPPGVSALSGKVALTEDTLKLKKLKVQVRDEPVVMDADMSHHILRDWQGRLAFSGIQGPYIEKWVRENGWVDKEYYLSVPCYVPEFQVELHPDTVVCQGKWVFDRGSSHEVSLYLSEQKGSRGFFIRKLRIEAPGEAAQLSLALPASGSSLDMSWEGRLSSDTANRIFERNRLVKGYIEGDFSLSLRSESGEGKDASETRGSIPVSLNPGLSNVRGNLELSRFIWPWGTKEPVIIENLRFKGKGSSAVLNEMALDIAGDTLKVAGGLLFTTKGIKYDLELQSPVFHKGSLETAWTPAERQLRAAGNVLPDNKFIGIEFMHNFKVYGNMAFELGRLIDSGMFHLSSESDNSTDRVSEIEISRLKGKIKVFPEGRMETHIRSGYLCGMRLSGNETICREGDVIRSYALRTPDNEEDMFKAMDACLGINSNMIEGPVKIDAYFYMQDAVIKKGHVDIASHDGKIRRFTLLSRIFSVVNLVDFLGKKGWQEMASGGLAYSKLVFRSIIKDNVLKIEKAAVMGNGLNLFATGNVDLDRKSMDVVVVVAPLKAVDAIVTNIPLIGQGLGGRHNSFITIPVGISGPVDNPDVKSLPVKTVTDILKKILVSPFEIPMRLLNAVDHEKPETTRETGMPASSMHMKSREGLKDHAGKKDRPGISNPDD